MLRNQTASTIGRWQKSYGNWCVNFMFQAYVKRYFPLRRVTSEERITSTPPDFETTAPANQDDWLALCAYRRQSAWVTISQRRCRWIATSRCLNPRTIQSS